MPIQVRAHGDVHVVVLHGEFTFGEGLARPLDLHGRPVDDLQQFLERLLHSGARKLLLHLEGVGFLDSAGLGALVRCKKRVAEGHGDIKLLRPGQAVRRVLQMTYLDRVFEIFDDEEQAVASFRPAPGRERSVGDGRHGGEA